MRQKLLHWVEGGRVTNLIMTEVYVLFSIICDCAWEKGPCRANNDFSV